ncbi:MAG: proteasome lid subunit RPN8/RPN11 [Flammeovirgaceae bacterium]|jgi:proteasome lid subunit RPN8/RPN11
MEIEEKYNKKLPIAYLNFLRENPEGDEIAFDEYKEENSHSENRYWQIMSESVLLETWEMNDVGKAMNFECLKLYIQVQREYSGNEFTESNVGKIDLNRVESGFVIGEENGDYLYIDSSDNYSVWIYYHDGGDVMRIANSFEDLLKED